VSVKPSQSSVAIRQFINGDIGAGLELCRIAGWNQLEADWECLLATAPDGLFSAVEDGRVWGTASAVFHPPSLGWIGMILVHPDKRGRGIAAALMDACIAHLRDKGAGAIKLDATELGHPGYLKLGFRDEQPIHRMVLECEPASDAPRNRMQPPAWFHDFDRSAFGADRSAALSHLIQCGEAEFFEGPRGDCAAAFLRHGFHATFLGPMVASGRNEAKTAIQRLLSRNHSKRIVADVFPEHPESRRLFEELGFQTDRRLMRMALGESSPAGFSPQTIAAAGFESG
jgi:GNAT superfamily N-acetyltransferase